MEEMNCTKEEEYCFSAVVEFGDPSGDYGEPHAVYYGNRGCATKKECDDESSTAFFSKKDCIVPLGGATINVAIQIFVMTVMHCQWSAPCCCWHAHL